MVAMGKDFCLCPHTRIVKLLFAVLGGIGGGGEEDGFAECCIAYLTPRLSPHKMFSSGNTTGNFSV